MSLDPQIIKRSIAYRAKYRLGLGDTPTYKIVAPLLVVPHPRNRGGVPVTSLRTKELIGTIVKEACDEVEANSSAVAVEERPLDIAAGPPPPNGNPRWRSFQADYEKGIANDASMAKRGTGITAVLGSLSHGHFNCGCRNIICGMPGCECPTHGDGDARAECKCKPSPILNADGNYSMAKLEKYDKSWHELCLTGIRWEVLTWKMDVEEPDAALVISIALSKKE